MKGDRGFKSNRTSQGPRQFSGARPTAWSACSNALPKPFFSLRFIGFSCYCPIANRLWPLLQPTADFKMWATGCKRLHPLDTENHNCGLYLTKTLGWKTPSMIEQKYIAAIGRQHGERQKLIFLNWLLIAACCVSLFFVPQYYPDYHIYFRSVDLFGAIVLIVAFAVVSLLFAFAGNNFGYIVGFYSYLMITGYLWLNHFSELIYNHRLAALSAAASAIFFLLPALFISSPLRQIYTLSSFALDRLLTLI